MQPFSVRCFGVGDGTASAERNHSAYLYTLGGTAVLVDCGEPVSRSYKAAGLSYDLVDRVFISHLHADHIGGFLMLLQGFWLEHRQKDLHVHLPAEGIEPLRQMLKACYLFEELLPFGITFSPWSSGVPLALGKLQVTPFPSSHLLSLKKRFQGIYPLGYAAFSFLLETDRYRLGHSADLGSPEDLEPLLAKPLDLLICELAHFRPADLFASLKGRRIKHIAFTHVARYHWERLEETRRLAAQALPEGSFSFPQDQELIQL